MNCCPVPSGGQQSKATLFVRPGECEPGSGPKVLGLVSPTLSCSGCQPAQHQHQFKESYSVGMADVVMKCDEMDWNP